jgi:hypothetical protein
MNAKLIPEPAEWANFLALEEVVMVGYPNGLWDSVNNMPIFRRGITATHLGLDYDGKAEFLIDAACFPGSSGSPVILYNEGAYRGEGDVINFGRRLRLLGILRAGPLHTAEGDIVIMNVPTSPRPVALTPQMINLGIVIKASRLLEFEPVIQALGSPPHNPA